MAWLRDLKSLRPSWAWNSYNENTLKMNLRRTFTSGRSKQSVRELQKNNDAMTGSTFTILPLRPVSWTLLALNVSPFCPTLHHDDHSWILFILRQIEQDLTNRQLGQPPFRSCIAYRFAPAIKNTALRARSVCAVGDFLRSWSIIRGSVDQRIPRCEPHSSARQRGGLDSRRLGGFRKLYSWQVVYPSCETFDKNNTQSSRVKSTRKVTRTQNLPNIHFKGELLVF